MSSFRKILESIVIRERNVRKYFPSYVSPPVTSDTLKKLGIKPIVVPESTLSYEERYDVESKCRLVRRL